MTDANKQSLVYRDRVQEIVLKHGGVIHPICFDRAFIELEDETSVPFVTIHSGGVKLEGAEIQFEQYSENAETKFFAAVTEYITERAPGTLYWRRFPDLKCSDTAPLGYSLGCRFEYKSFNANAPVKLHSLPNYMLDY